MSRVTIEVYHTDELTQLFASFWDCEGLNGLDFLWYGHNPVKSDVITQIFKKFGVKSLFSGVDFDPSLLEAGEHIFEDSKAFCPRSFCNIQKVVDVKTHCV